MGPSMVDFKEVLRLRAEGVSQRGIADVLGCSRNNATTRRPLTTVLTRIIVNQRRSDPPRLTTGFQEEV